MSSRAFTSVLDYTIYTMSARSSSQVTSVFGSRQRTTTRNRIPRKTRRAHGVASATCTARYRGTQSIIPDRVGPIEPMGGMYGSARNIFQTGAGEWKWGERSPSPVGRGSESDWPGQARLADYPLYPEFIFAGVGSEPCSARGGYWNDLSLQGQTQS